MASNTIVETKGSAGEQGDTGVVSSNVKIVAIVAIFDGGGSVIADETTIRIEVPFAGTITETRIIADVTGSIEIDIWKDTLGNYPPLVGDSITSATPPALTGEITYSDTSLSGWTTSITAEDILFFVVNGASTTLTQCTCTLVVSKT